MKPDSARERRRTVFSTRMVVLAMIHFDHAATVAARANQNATLKPPTKVDALRGTIVIIATRMSTKISSIYTARAPN